MKRPRLFISYSHQPPEHKEQVVRMVADLRADEAGGVLKFKACKGIFEISAFDRSLSPGNSPSSHETTTPA